MRTIIDYAPFLDLTKFFGERGRWPAKWISHADATGSGPAVQALRRAFTLDRAQTIRVHVSADERYELYLDGQRVGRGPERGDRLNWFYETYDLPLGAGTHTIVARCWWLGDAGPAPYAQISRRPGFVLAAETEDRTLLNTGVADWQAKLLTGYRHVPPGVTWGTGSKVHIVGSEFQWDYETGGGDGWAAARANEWAVGSDQFMELPATPALTPAVLPAMIDRPVHVGRARHVQAMPQMPAGETPVHAADHLAAEATAWDALLAGERPLVVPPRTVRRVIVDLQNYFCAYTDLVTTGGRGSVIRSWWAEALYLPADAGTPLSRRAKGNRDDIEGKVFLGVGDTFEPDGGHARLFNTLWWEAGRYLEIVVATADEPLTIERFSLRETHYPTEWAGRFDASDARLGTVTPIAKRVMEMCSHETYMDCPYYEQLMYVGDTRLEVLTSYAWSADDRLPRKSIKLFDDSRKSPGFTQSRYPSRTEQMIPPFAAWWVAMVHDFAMWRDDAAFVRARLPGVRGVMDAFTQHKTADGLIAGPAGWNFIDWVPGWPHGMPPGSDTGGVTAPLNFKLAWVFKQAAELEDAFGEPELAALYRRHAADIGRAAAAQFWDESRGLFADDLKRTNFSEHAQCLALLGDVVDADRRPRVIDHLFTDETLARTTVYFSHYLFETCALVGRLDSLFDRLKLWFDLPGQGFKTTLEMPEPSRSDCHAWGAQPLFHYLATLLGVRPAKPGFAEVVIRPQLGPLAWATGTIVHPKGLIDVDVKQTDGKLSGRVTLPAGVSGHVVANGTRTAIGDGVSSF